MRPNSLNPLFAEATALPGVGPAVGRALSRLGIDRAVDLLFHLPVSAIERVPIEELSPAWIDRVVTIEIVVLHHLEGRGKAPTRVACVDRNHTPLTLVYFADRGGYAKKILPPGERRLISGRLEAYGTMLHFTTGECLIENNIFEHLRHSTIVQAGANGNVFGYKGLL